MWTRNGATASAWWVLTRGPITDQTVGSLLMLGDVSINIGNSC